MRLVNLSLFLQRSAFLLLRDTCEVVTLLDLLSAEDDFRFAPLIARILSIVSPGTGSFVYVEPVFETYRTRQGLSPENL